MTSSLQSSRVTLSAGVELDIGRAGDPDGRSIVLLHGVTDSWRAFAPLASQLPRDLDIIAVSQRGHGDSSRPDGAYRIDSFVADLAELLDRLGVERPVILGHSMGSVIAQRFALDHPTRAAGLVLIGAWPTLRGDEGVSAFHEAEIKGLTDPVDPAFVRAFQESTLFRAVPERFLDAVVTESLKVPAHVWRACFQALLTDDFSSQLRDIVCPTLIVWGEEDAFAGRDAQLSLRRRLRGSRLSIHEATGHAPHWEAPCRVAREIVDFIATLPCAVRAA